MRSAVLILILLAVIGFAGFWIINDTVLKEAPPISGKPFDLRALIKSKAESQSAKPPANKPPVITPPPSAQTCASAADKDECYKGIAILKLDPALCGKIAAADQKNDCLAFTSSNPDNCESAIHRDLCFYNFALEKKQAGLCEKIGDPATKQECLETLKLLKITPP